MQVRGFAVNADGGRMDGHLALLADELELYARLGFSHVEISPHGTGVMMNGRLRKEKMSELLGVLSGQPFGYTVHGPNPLNLMRREGPAFEEELFRASLEFTAQVGAEIMVYHAGRFCPEEDFLLPVRREITLREKEEMWARECSLLNRLGDLAAQFNVFIAVENSLSFLDGIPHGYGEFLDQLSVMVRAVGHPRVGVTLDFGHAYVAACHHKYDLLAGVRVVAPYVRHIHLHDNFGKICSSYERNYAELGSTGRGDLHLPIGWGEVPAGAMFSCLPDYDGVITLEIRERFREGCAEALSNARALVENCSMAPGD